MQHFGSVTIVVCGGAGFIGSDFIRRTMREDTKVRIVCLDALTYAGNRENLEGVPENRFVFVKGDIADQKIVRKVFQNHRPSYVINFAAETHVDRSIHGDAGLFIRTNVDGTRVLLQELLRAPFVKKFLQVSTDEVYGSLSLGSKKKFREDTPLQPSSPYAASKAAADMITRSFFITHGVPVVIARCANNYGPHQYPEKFIPFSIHRLLCGEKVALYGDGKHVRDWIHVSDHTAALSLILQKGRSGEIYNISTGDEMDNVSLARLLLVHCGKDESQMMFIPDRPGHDRRYASDSAKIRSLGWRPRHSLASALPETVAWYKDNREWMRRALGRGGANSHIPGRKRKIKKAP